jgi:hypothetical protein
MTEIRIKTRIRIKRRTNRKATAFAVALVLKK